MGWVTGTKFQQILLHVVYQRCCCGIRENRHRVKGTRVAGKKQQLLFLFTVSLSPMIFQNSSQPYHLSHACNVFPFLLPILSSPCVSRAHPHPMVFAVGFQFNVRFKYNNNQTTTKQQPNNNQTTTKRVNPPPKSRNHDHPPLTRLRVLGPYVRLHLLHFRF